MSFGSDRHRPVLLFVVNVDWFFVSHRLHLAQAAIEAGFDVHVAAERTSEADVSRIEAAGARFHRVSFARGRASFAAELRTIGLLIRLYRAVRPDIIHHVTSKPILLGTLAARLCGIAVIVNAVSGLGYLFSDARRMQSLAARTVFACYRVLFNSRRVWIIFQNADDAALFRHHAIARAERMSVIRGSGVDPAVFHPEEKSKDCPVVVLPARMLWDKGVREFCEAAGFLAAEGVDARFELLGGLDPSNPASISREWLADHTGPGKVVTWAGHCADMSSLLGRADIVCLPSYREGLPKALLEAASCECALVASDVPGCREIVVHERTGLLVPVRDPRALAVALRRLIDSAALRRQLGTAARQLVVSELSMRRVQDDTLALYRDLLRRAASRGG